jgi:hypothetical protein
MIQHKDRNGVLRSVIVRGWLDKAVGKIAKPELNIFLEWGNEGLSVYQAADKCLEWLKR